MIFEIPDSPAFQEFVAQTTVGDLQYFSRVAYVLQLSFAETSV